MAKDHTSLSAWRQITHSMSSRHEMSSAWHGCRECSRMCRMKEDASISPQGPCGTDLKQCYSIVSFQDMIISGLQPETSYSLTVTAYTTKGDGARSKPKLVSTTGAGTVSVQTCVLNMFWAAIIVMFQMVWVASIREENKLWSPFVIFDI